MFDYNKKFIALGIIYNEKNFSSLVNRKVYNDNNFPPTKPIKGGLWGSSLYKDNKYKSAWEEYIYTTLNPSLFDHRLKNKSSVFSIKENSKVLVLNQINDVYIKFTADRTESNLSLRTIKVGGNVPKVFENHLYVDFEDLPNHYDAIYVTQNFVNKVDSLLKEFDNLVLNNKSTEKIPSSDLYVSEMFEDWNVDSLLVLNKDCITILDTI